MRCLFLVFAITCAACGEPACDAASLASQLASAINGDLVEADGCVYEGDDTIAIPAGVTLRGVSSTVIAAPITLGDRAVLESVTVRVETGVAVRAEEAQWVALSDVTIEGPIDEASAATVPPRPTSDETATHGLVLVDSGSELEPAVLEDVRVHGFGRIGALFVDSHVQWNRGEASRNLGTGLMASGGSVGITNVEICSNWRGLQPFAYGAVFESARVTSSGAIVCENEGPGMLHEGATASHETLTAMSNREPALWVQRGGAFALDGSTLDDNGLSAIVIVDTSDVRIASSQIRSTREVTTIVGDVGEVRAGDGIEVIADSAAGLELIDLTITGNERVGLLLQIASGVIPSGTLDRVVVESDGEAFGAIAQTSSATLTPDAWSDGLERRGAAIANDASPLDPLSVVSAVAPMFLPPPEL